MKYKIISQNEYKTSKWSGGETTELFIYPEKSEYKKRNFIFRLSSATVNEDESNFTKLNKVLRKLMIISGKIKLVHKDKYSKVLGEFEQDSFNGSWDTKSYGICRDFNLMTSENCKSNLCNIEVNKDLEISSKGNLSKADCFYNLGEGTEFILNEEKLVLKKEDLLVVLLNKEDKDLKIKLLNKENLRQNIIRSEIYF